MFMRRRPLLRAVAVDGGAHVARKRAARRATGQARQDDEQNERLLSLEQRGQAQSAEGGHAPSMLDQLGRLAALHRQGALTDAEFSAAKAKLLGR